LHRKRLRLRLLIHGQEGAVPGYFVSFGDTPMHRRPVAPLLSAVFAMGLSALASHAVAQSYFMVSPNPLGRAASSTPEQPDAELSIALAAGDLPDAMLGKDYSQDLARFLSVTGGSGEPPAVSWALGSGHLPAGLSLNSAGVVSGKPSTLDQAGASFEVIASALDKNGRQTYTIKVGEAVLQVAQITTGSAHACAITASGGVVCWGDNRQGQLGDGTTTTSRTPVHAVGLSAGVAQISSGASHSCAVTTAGAALCWGANTNAQIGDGIKTTVSRLTPTPVMGLSAGTASIQAGAVFSCALTTSGAVKCWGSNSNGELGDGTQTTQFAPVDVAGLSSGVTDLSVGWNHACAVTSTGGIQCWGANGGWQLGDGTQSNRSTPVNVIGLAGSAVRVSAGGSHTCAVISAGAVQCWGNNSFGQLGVGSLATATMPKNVGLTGVTKVATSDAHSCALTNTGAVYCWGANSYGQLGDGSKVTRNTPVQVLKLDSPAFDIDVGVGYSCAATTGGAMCWGLNELGSLGNGAGADSKYPVKVSSD
jgi:alpha-tubulin suppressor-like RCC1 family protein